MVYVFHVYSIGKVPWLIPMPIMSKYCFLGRVLPVPAPVPSPFAIRDGKAEATREILVKILEHLGQKKINERVMYLLVLCCKIRLDLSLSGCR